jgi:hypothetical protein
MHHSEQPMQSDPVDRAAIEAQILRLGATGQFPQGKIDKTDEGEIAIAIGHKQNKVVINFGKPVAWIGFDKRQALEIAQLIRSHAQQIP